MLSLGGGFPPPPLPTNTSLQSSCSQFFPFPRKINQSQPSFVSDVSSLQASRPLLAHLRTGSSVSVVKNGRRGENGPIEIEGLDEEDEFDYVDDSNAAAADEDGEFVPLRSMKKWLEKKPSGFGEGKEYDTSIEDKLLEEMEQSRQAQLANINKLKNNPETPNSKNEIGHEKKASEVVPSGFRVRLFNLPKKKNIDRDLQQAFKGVPGIVNIIPAVSGNKKTREPICKGFAFIDLKSKEDANRFAQILSGQSISFGKIQKQIRCEVMNSKARSPAKEQSADISYTTSQPSISCLSEVQEDDFEIDDGSSDSWDLITANEIEVTENLGSSNLSEPVIGIGLETRSESALGSISSKQLERIYEKGRKEEPKRKRPKVPKLNIPGSANRLKIKDMAVLTGVLSKYAAQTASALKD